MSPRLALRAAALFACALGFAGCTRPRTEIVLRMRTDMTQGPSGELTAVRVHVVRDDQIPAADAGDPIDAGDADAAVPGYSNTFTLGVDEGSCPHCTLPQDLGLYADGHTDAHLTIEIDAVHGGTVLFTRRFHVQYVPQQTLLLDAFLAHRCTDATTAMCPTDRTCGETQCDPIDVSSLPTFTPDDSGAGGMDSNLDVPCNVVCSGACTDIQNDPHHCGGCGNDCTLLPNVGEGATCSAGACVINGHCDPGHADCNTTVNDGCEADLSQADNCGMCSNMCAAPTPFCADSDGGFACQNHCGGSTPTQCNTSCTNTNTDPVNCGSCNMVCIGAENATPTCTGGSCGFECNATFHLCNGACASNSAVATCGTGCTPCTPPPSHGQATCDGTVCGVSCDPGYMPSGGNCVTAAPVPAPRPIGPTSTGVVTTLRPTFHWAATAGTDGARVEVCRDRACTMVVATAEGSGTSATLTTPLAVAGSRVYYWRLYGKLGGATGATPGVVWSFTARGRATMVDSSWGCVPDVNGDGFADLITGTSSNVVRVYDGSSGAMATTATQTLTGAAGAGFGASVAAVGDVNGDGYADVIVGSPTAGSVAVYHGGASGLAMTPAITINGPAGSDFGTSVAGAGDVNADGYADVIVGAPSLAQAFVYYGSAAGVVMTSSSTLNGASGSRFGFSVSSAGDVNGDGRADVVVGAPDAASAFMFHGTAPSLPSTVAVSSAQATLAGTAATQFGAAVASADDTNGDGYSDVIVGAPLDDVAYIYNGSATGVPAMYSGALRKPTPAGSGPIMFGQAVGGVGDGNNDGYADVIVGAPGVAGMAGLSIAYIFHGGASGFPITASGSSTAHNRSYSNTSTSSRLGVAVTGVGDITGDGFDDLAVGAPGSLNSIYVEYGSAAGFPMTTSATLAGSGVTGFGTSLACRTPARPRARVRLALLAR